MATQIGTIELIAKIDTSQYKKGASEIAQSNKDIENSSGEADKANERTNHGLLALAKNGLKVAAVGVVGLSTVVAGMAAKGGFARALNIEDAQAKLRGLGHDAVSVKTIMENALSSVKGTAFGLDSAATTAANAVASGIKPGKQLEQVLKTVANTSALAGRDMSELGSIFNKVAASNKVQMDVINQLHDAGVPALALLSKEIGKTSEQTAKMASEGKIDFETFEKAMRNGVGNAALEMGNTTRGSLDNMRAAFSRTGAIVADKILPHLRESIQGVTTWVDGVAKALPGMIDRIGSQFKKLGDGFNNVRDVAAGGDYKSLGENIGSGISKGLNTALASLKIGMDTVSHWFDKIEWGELGISIGKQSVAFLIGFAIGLADFDMSSAFRTLADNWLPALLGVLGLLFAPAKFAKPIGKFLSKIPFAKTFIKYILLPIRNMGSGVRSAFGDMFANLGSTISGKFGSIGNILKGLGNIIVSPIRITLDFLEAQIRLLPLTVNQTFNSIVSVIKGILGAAVNAVRIVFSGIWSAITTVMRPLTTFFSNLFSSIWSNVQSIFSGAAGWFGSHFLQVQLAIQNAFGNIVQWFAGRWGAIMGVFENVALWFAGKFGAAANAVRGAFSSIGGWFSNMWNSIVSLFGNAGTRVGDAIGGAFKSVMNQIFNGAMKIINGFIRSINAVTGSINKVPGVNIGKISELNIPQLATGGIVSSPTLAMIGEGREAEAVIPLSKLDKILAQERNGSSTGSGETKIEQTNNIYTDIDMNAVNRRLAWEFRRA